MACSTGSPDRRGPHEPSLRLRTIADLVPPGCAVVADVGSGHARLARLLLATGRAARCIASEKPGPTARRLARTPPVSGLEIRVGDGLDVLRERDGVEVLVLAGMGGRTIADLLERRLDRASGVRRVILQPQGEQALLRRRLYAHGLAIVDERLVQERDRFYLILAAEPRSDARLPCHASLTADDLLEAGPCLVLRGGPTVERYWRRQLRRLDSILDRPGAAGRERVRRDRDRARRVLAALV